jgi:hypothetical protein
MRMLKRTRFCEACGHVAVVLVEAAPPHPTCNHHSAECRPATPPHNRCDVRLTCVFHMQVSCACTIHEYLLILITLRARPLRSELSAAATNSKAGRGDRAHERARRPQTLRQSTRATDTALGARTWSADSRL